MKSHRPLAQIPRHKAKTHAKLSSAIFESLESRRLMSLVAAYNFNEGSGTTVNDLSGAGNNGSFSSGVSWTTGKYGGALSFAGASGNYVTVPDANSLDLTTGMTLEAWIYPTSNVDKQDVLIKEATTDYYNLYSRNSTSGAGARPEGNVYVTSANYTAVGSSQVPINTWTHLAATYDGSNLKLYVNGTLAATTSISGAISTSNGPLRIGGNSLWGEYFVGKIDEVRVYNNALTSTAIQDDMTTLIGQMSYAGPVAAYDFNENTGSSVADLSGHANTGTITGASWTSSGKYSNALSFSGTTGSPQWVTVADANSLDLTTGMTLEAWVYPTSNSGKQDVLIKESTVDYYNLYSRNSTSGAGARPEGNIYVTSANYTAVGGSQIGTNTWTHLAATYDGSVLKLYVNDSLVASTSISGAISTSNGSLRIGGNSIWGEFFQGRIDEVRVYSRPLSESEIGSDKDNLPAAPSGFAATAASGSQIDLSWTDNGFNETGFVIQRATSSDFSANLTTLTGPSANATSASDTGLTSSTVYYYRIKATNSQGDSPWVAITGPPLAPTDLVVASTSGNQFDLEWEDNATDETGYFVEQSTDGVTYTLLDTLPANASSFTTTGLTLAPTRHFHVVAMRGAAVSAAAAAEVDPPMFDDLRISTLSIDETVATLGLTSHSDNSNWSFDVKLDGGSSTHYGPGDLDQWGFNPESAIGGDAINHVTTHSVTVTIHDSESGQQSDTILPFTVALGDTVSASGSHMDTFVLRQISSHSVGLSINLAGETTIDTDTYGTILIFGYKGDDTFTEDYDNGRPSAPEGVGFFGQEDVDTIIEQGRFGNYNETFVESVNPDETLPRNDVTWVGEKLKINADGGNDTISLDFNNPGPDDIVQLISIMGGEGDDDIEMSKTYGASSIVVDAGDGNDTVVLDDDPTAGTVSIVGGLGDDDIQVTHPAASTNITLDGGDGDDHLAVFSASVNDVLRIIGDTGDDDIEVRTPSGSITSSIIGGLGDDDIALTGLDGGTQRVYGGEARAAYNPLAMPPTASDGDFDFVDRQEPGFDSVTVGGGTGTEIFYDDGDAWEDTGAPDVFKTADFETVTIDQTGSSVGHPWSISDHEISADDDFSLEMFSPNLNFDKIAFLGGSDGETINVEPVNAGLFSDPAADVYSLHGGPGDDQINVKRSLQDAIGDTGSDTIMVIAPASTSGIILYNLHRGSFSTGDVDKLILDGSASQVTSGSYTVGDADMVGRGLEVESYGGGTVYEVDALELRTRSNTSSTIVVNSAIVPLTLIPGSEHDTITVKETLLHGTGSGVGGVTIMASDGDDDVTLGTISALCRVVFDLTDAGSGGHPELTFGALDIASHGVVALENAPSAFHAMEVASLTIDSGGKLDLNAQGIIIDSGTVSTLRGTIKDGFGGTTGIFTSQAPGVGRVIAVDEADWDGSSTFYGRSIPANSVLLGWVAGGYAGIDQAVDLTDLTLLALNWQAGIDTNYDTPEYDPPIPPVAPGTNGDFNGDGNVDITDLSLLALNWNDAMSFASALSSVGL